MSTDPQGADESSKIARLKAKRIALDVLRLRLEVWRLSIRIVVILLGVLGTIVSLLIGPL